MKFEVILRVQDTRYSEKVDRYRCVVTEDRLDYVRHKYEECEPDNVYGSWVLINKLDDNGEFLEVVQ